MAPDLNSFRTSQKMLCHERHNTKTANGGATELIYLFIFTDNGSLTCNRKMSFDPELVGKGRL